MTASTSTRRQTRHTFGARRVLPSGRHQASYVGPDGQRYTAPSTFTTAKDADAWLAGVQTEIARGLWRDPHTQAASAPTFASYAERWLTNRVLKPRTRDEYRKLLDRYLVPEFGPRQLAAITISAVSDWHARLSNMTGPTQQSHCYSLLRTMLNTAVSEELIAANPCRVRGAGQAKRAGAITLATPGELKRIIEAMRPEYRAAVLIAAWCGLRFGEVAELRRADVDLRGGRLIISRGVVVVQGEYIVGDPKSFAGRRSVAIPKSLLPIVRAHLIEHVGPTSSALLFPSAGDPERQLRSDGMLHRDFHAARVAAGRPDLRFHDLRHTGASMATQAGASLAEVMRRLGHSTSVAAMRYQHANDDRDEAIADRLSAFYDSGDNVIPLRAPGRHRG